MRSALAVLGASLLSLGCSRSASVHDPADAALSATNSGLIYSECIIQLHELLGEERHLSKLLVVKRESDELEKLVKEISASAGRYADALEKLAKEDAAIHLDRAVLPPGEQAVRKAISKTKQETLLKTKNEQFEFQLLLTQVEALGYGTHLAQVAAEHAPSPDQAGELLGIRADLLSLHERVIQRLQRLRPGQ